MTVRRTAAVAGAALLVSAGAALAAFDPFATDPADPAFSPIGTYTTGLANVAAGAVAGETSDLEAGRLFVTNSTGNSLDIVDASDPAHMTLIKRVDLSPYGGGPNSVDASGGLVAVAVEAAVKTDPGSVVLLDRDGTFVKRATVGSLPDMLAFTPNGNRIVVANEGEPSSYDQPTSVDPEGSVSVIRVDKLLAGRADAVRTVRFTAFNAGGPRHAQLPPGIRLNGPNASVAQDLEPEYVAFDPADDDRAVVTLQEANALAVIDIDDGRVQKIVSLGEKDHSLPGQGLDPSDRDNAIRIANWPVRGLPMPDAVASFRVGLKSFYITANEGDGRDYNGFVDETTVGNATYVLDPTAFPNASALKANAALGRLTVSKTDGDTDGDGDYDAIYSYGARSATIWDANGAKVADTGDMFEQATAALLPTFFNSNNSVNNLDNRSDNKGPEPEGVATGRIGDRTYAFVGLERVGGFVILDVTDPTSPAFVQWANNRTYVAGGPVGQDSGPEVVKFVSAAKSPTGAPLVVVSNEVTGTVTFYPAGSRHPRWGPAGAPGPTRPGETRRRSAREREVRLGDVVTHAEKRHPGQGGGRVGHEIAEVPRSRRPGHHPARPGADHRPTAPRPGAPGSLSARAAPASPVPGI